MIPVMLSLCYTITRNQSFNPGQIILDKFPWPHGTIINIKTLRAWPRLPKMEFIKRDVVTL